MKNDNKRPVFIIWILLAVSIGLNVFQWMNIHQLEQESEGKVDSLLSARVDVEQELSDTHAELSKYRGISGRLDSLLREAENNLSNQKTRIDELIRDEKNHTSLNKKLQSELSGLKTLRQEYLEKIDALLVENETLKKEKNELTTAVENLTRNLDTTIHTAAVIRSEYFKVTAYKKRVNNKYVSTAIAKRTNKLEACFTLLDNAIAQPGSKIIYLRIIEPGGRVLGNRANRSSAFKKSGSNEEILFTKSIQENYSNKKKNICLEWEESDRVFASGTYMVEVYVDGTISGLSSISLQ